VAGHPSPFRGHRRVLLELLVLLVPLVEPGVLRITVNFAVSYSGRLNSGEDSDAARPPLDHLRSPSCSW
jgi:hypothetical protein